MRRQLLRSAAFVRDAARLRATQPQISIRLLRALERLAEDAFDPRLNTHKLKGKLADVWAASAGYNLRIVFEFVQCKGVESILLHTVGTHDEVY